MKLSILKFSLASCTILSLLHYCVATHNHAHEQHILIDHEHDTHAKDSPYNEPDPISFETRAHWMRQARAALLDVTGSPCPFAAFGTAIVNHTGQPGGSLGELVCIGANQMAQVGNPTLHGEISAINNCTAILAKPPYNLKPKEILAAFKQLSLYTTGEACPMCATAISWAQFSEYIYATSIWKQYELGWKGIDIGSREMLDRSPIKGKIRIVGGVLEEEMDELLGWQFGEKGCPKGCGKDESGKRKCVKLK